MAASVMLDIVRQMRTLFLLAALSLAGCGGDNDWDMVSKQEFPAPDGRRVATVFVMSCHCTTGDFAELSIRKPGEVLGKRGNVFEVVLARQSPCGGLRRPTWSWSIARARTWLLTRPSGSKWRV